MKISKPRKNYELRKETSAIAALQDNSYLLSCPNRIVYELP